MLNRLGPRLRLVLVLAGLLPLLLATAALLWFLPPRPRVRWQPDAEWSGPTYVSQDGQTLVSTHEWGLAMWDLPTGRARTHLPINIAGGERILRVFLAPNGRHVAVNLISRHVPGQIGYPVNVSYLWSPDVQPQPRPLPGWCLGMTPDGRSLIVEDEPLRSVDTATGASHPLGHANVNPYVVGSPFLPDGRLLVICRDPHEADHALAVTWADHGRGAAQSVRFRNSADQTLVLSPDGRFCATTVGGQVKLWDLNDGQEWATLSGPEDESAFLYHADRSFVFSPDSRRLIIGHTLDTRGGPTGVSIWDVTTAPCRQCFRGEYSTLRFAPDGKWLAACRLSGAGGFEWDILETGTFTRHAILGELHGEPVFAPDSRTLVATVQSVSPASPLVEWLTSLGLMAPPLRATQTHLGIWNVQDGRLLGTLEEATLFTFTPDGQSLVICAVDQSIELWDLPPRRPAWVGFGLPIAFALLVLVGVRLVWRTFRQRPEPAPG
jgi:WD40 repeat protein